jgi:hypothetical protein
MGRLIVNMPRYNVPEAGVTVALVNTRTAAVVARQNVHAGDTVVFEDIDRWMLTDEYRLRIRGVGILPFDTTAWRAGNDSSSEDVEHNPHFERDVVLPEIWPEEPPLRTTPQQRPTANHRPAVRAAASGEHGPRGRSGRAAEHLRRARPGTGAGEATATEHGELHREPGDR